MLVLNGLALHLQHMSSTGEEPSVKALSAMLAGQITLGQRKQTLDEDSLQANDGIGANGMIFPRLSQQLGSCLHCLSNVNLTDAAADSGADTLEHSPKPKPKGIPTGERG